MKADQTTNYIHTNKQTNKRRECKKASTRTTVQIKMKRIQTDRQNNQEMIDVRVIPRKKKKFETKCLNDMRPDEALWKERKKKKDQVDWLEYRRTARLGKE